MFDLTRFVPRVEMEVYQCFGHYYVSRRKGNRRETAQNWRELEGEVYADIWPLLMPGDFHRYPCPRPVAAKAVFVEASS